MSTASNMATITAALERSLQNCSLSHSHSHHRQVASADSQGGIRSSSSDEISQMNHHHHHRRHLQPPNSGSDTTLELNSHISLPYHWEQCLDLKTGEIYYINWRNGMKAKEDPRSTTEYSEDYYLDDDDSSYDSEESSTESSTFASSREQKINNHRVEEEDEEEEEEERKEDQVLVVAGCKSCLMYFMVPKHLEDCPKCTGQLLHFDRSDNDIP